MRKKVNTHDIHGPIKATVISGIDKISADQWNACSGLENPFVTHEFLSALEDSGSVCEDSGWLPQHLLIQDKTGEVLGAAPAYLKSHSFGEYVFDWGWAEAFERAGGKYYPKLQVAVPFTPVTGPRFLIRDTTDRELVKTALAEGLIELAKELHASSLHVTFCEQKEHEYLMGNGFLKRIGKQFHWHNRGYETFEDFLSTLTSRKRKSVRKERTTANQGIKIETLSGQELREEHMEFFYEFYLNTIDRKWAHAYLNREFFSLLRERLANKIVLFLASKEKSPIAGALNFLGTNSIFGRNWGYSVQSPMLYFEMCFYRAIDYAIQHQLSKVEAGAQGPHKISRGYLPSETYSAHWISHEGFRNAIDDYLKKETSVTRHEMTLLERQMSPYRKDL
ncbi:MAG: GNAT family N-acetyltransferase [Rhodospirillaceae bacterium]